MSRRRSFVAEAELPASVEVAFATLADPSTAHVIDPAVRRYEPEALPMAVGTRIRIAMTVFHLPLRAESVVVAWEPHRRMAMEATRPRWPVLVEAEHTFEPSANGCRYRWSLAATATGWPGRLLVGPFLRHMEVNARAQQDRFAAMLRDRA